MSKLIHIAMPTKRSGLAVRRVLCGRRVGLMSTGREDEATCKQCLAASLLQPRQLVARKLWGPGPRTLEMATTHCPHGCGKPFELYPGAVHVCAQ